MFFLNMSFQYQYQLHSKVPKHEQIIAKICFDFYFLEETVGLDWYRKERVKMQTKVTVIYVSKSEIEYACGMEDSDL